MNICGGCSTLREDWGLSPPLQIPGPPCPPGTVGILMPGGTDVRDEPTPTDQPDDDDQDDEQDAPQPEPQPEPTQA